MANTSHGNQVLPSVSMILPCDAAIYYLTTDKWVIEGPWYPYRILKPGVRFPFRQIAASVYVQLVGGVGTSYIAVEMRRKRNEDPVHQSYRTVGTSGTTELQFDAIHSRLAVLDTAFEFKKLPFRSEGTYEFRVLGETSSGWEVLRGPVFEFTILESRGRI